MVKLLPDNAGNIRDLDSIHRSGRLPGRGHDNPPQYSCLENPRQEEPGGATVYKVAESDTTEGTQHNSISAVQLLSCDPMDCSTPGLPVHHQLLELLQFMFIKSVMPSNHLLLCRPLLLLPSIFPSIRVFSSESILRIR